MTLPPPPAVATPPLRHTASLPPHYGWSSVKGFSKCAPAELQEPAKSMLSPLSRAETPQAQSHMWPHTLLTRVMLEDAAWLDSHYKHSERHGPNRGCRAAIVTLCDDDSDTGVSLGAQGDQPEALLANAKAGGHEGTTKNVTMGDLEDYVPVDCGTDGHGNPIATEFSCSLLMRAASL